MREKTVLYLAGKITGDPGYREKFSRWAEVLGKSGAIVLNPAELPEGMEPGEYMRICLAMIDTADAVALIPGWRSSAGARVEKAYCDYIKKRIILLTGDGREWDVFE